MAAATAKHGGLLVFLFIFTLQSGCASAPKAGAPAAQPSAQASAPAADTADSATDSGAKASRKWLWLEIGAWTVAAIALGSAIATTHEESETVAGAVTAFAAGAATGFHFTRKSVQRAPTEQSHAVQPAPQLVLNWDF